MIVVDASRERNADNIKKQSECERIWRMKNQSEEERKKLWILYQSLLDAEESLQRASQATQNAERELRRFTKQIMEMEIESDDEENN